VDFKIKFLSVGGKKLKLTIWDTGKVLFFPVSDNGPNTVNCCLGSRGNCFTVRVLYEIFFCTVLQPVKRGSGQLPALTTGVLMGLF
jgi:hypothetical protein